MSSTMDLSTLPNNLLLSTMQKMRSIIFCRAVRTCKRWKETAEKGKKQLKIRMRDAEDRSFGLNIDWNCEYGNMGSLSVEFFRIITERYMAVRVPLRDEQTVNCMLEELADLLSPFGYFHLEQIEINLWASKIPENDDKELYRILKEIGIRCTKLRAPSCYWTNDALSAFRPRCWEIDGTCDETDMKEILTPRVDVEVVEITKRIPADLPLLTRQNTYNLFESGINIQADCFVLTEETMTFLGKWLDKIRLGQVPLQEGHLRFYNKQDYLELETYLPFEFHMRIVVTLVEGEDPSSYDILLAQMGEEHGHNLCIAIFEKKNETYESLHYGVVKNWEQFETWLEGVHYESSLDDEPEVRALFP